MNYENSVITKRELTDFFKEIGITKGCTVLLQADLSSFPYLIGMETTLLETLQTMIGPSGCLIVPTFTFHVMDPACHLPGQEDHLLYEGWKTIRKESPGFCVKTTPADLSDRLANTFLLQNKAKRSDHPVYSFAWSGSVPMKSTVDSLHYPISYQHILRLLKAEKAFNLMMGLPLEKSLLIKMQARQMNVDVTTLKSALVKKVCKCQEVQFLDSVVSNEAVKVAKENLDIAQMDFHGLPIYKIMQPLILP